MFRITVRLLLRRPIYVKVMRSPPPASYAHNSRAKGMSSRAFYLAHPWIPAPRQFFHIGNTDFQGFQRIESIQLDPIQRVSISQKLR